MKLPFEHEHVSEREVAHNWPDGQHDDGAWEDCTYCSGLELARLCFDIGIPATHAEAELLRDASGKPPTKGANVGDLIRGVQRRYGWLTGYVEVAGFDILWATLQQGMAAAAAGRPAAFPYGHRLRRWDRNFVGLHRSLIIRLDDTDRVWWCDPLAPAGAYRGEWMTKAELRTYVLGGPGTHLVAPLSVGLPDTGTGDTVKGIDFECVRPAPGTFTFTDDNAVMLPTNGDPPIPVITKDYERTTFAEIVMTGSLYSGRQGWLAGQGTQAVICMAFTGRFKAATLPPADCSAIASQLATAKARIATIKDKVAKNAADVADD